MPDIFDKKCPKCKQFKPYTPEFFPRDAARASGLDYYCRICRTVSQKATRSKYAERYTERQRQHNRNNKLKTKYGITWLEYQSLIAQNQGICPCCTEAFDGVWCVDFDRVAKKVRGLLCTTCSRKIALLNRYPYLFPAYLELSHDNINYKVAYYTQNPPEYE